VTRSVARFWLGCGVLTLGAVYLCVLVFVEVPQANERIIDFAAALVLGWGGAVVQFYFGSSSGSSEKDQAIHALATLDERVQR
jgi:hypothetical protein